MQTLSFLQQYRAYIAHFILALIFIVLVFILVELQRSNELFLRFNQEQPDQFPGDVREEFEEGFEDEEYEDEPSQIKGV